MISDRYAERDRQRSLFRPIPDATDRYVTGVTDSEYERFLRLRAEDPRTTVADGAALEAGLQREEWAPIADLTPLVEGVNAFCRQLAELTRAPGERPSFEDYFFELADLTATRADCTRRKVGAVLVGPSKRIVATGYNGAPAGIPGCATANACPRGRLSHAELPRDAPYDAQGQVCLADHAERNAVTRFLELMVELGVPRDVALDYLKRCTLYVSDTPCPQCSALLEAVEVSWRVRG